LRSNWIETTRDDPATAPARGNYFMDRPPDGVFYKDRADGNERIELRIWLSPWTMDQGLVWVGQVVYGVNDASLFAEFFTPHSPGADLDSAVRFILQDFWYNQSVIRAGYVGGVGRVPKDYPRVSFSGHEYFTEGTRLVMQLSEEPVAFDETIIIYPDTPLPELGDDE
jgi:hypothetical protein